MELKNLPRVFKLDTMPMVERIENFSRTAIRTEQSLHTIAWFEPGYKTKGPHSHPFDQISYVLSGAMRFWVGDEIIELQSPGAIYIPGGVPHCAETLGDERALNIDVFAPAREDYLFLCEHQQFVS